MSNLAQLDLKDSSER